ncbi:MAG: hypothetical protein ACKVQS_10150 [Fimbriimonadaceae bacterium]
MRFLRSRFCASCAFALAMVVSASAAVGDQWIVSGWPQVDGTWLFDYTEGNASATNGRALNFGGNTASLMVSGMDFDNQNRLFAMTSSGFYEVATATGDLTLRGAFGIGIEGAAAYDPSQNRFLVASGFGGIEEVNMTTFAHNSISPLTGIDDVSGIAVENSGRIWILASNGNGSNNMELYELQGSTPVSYGNLGISAAGVIAGFDVDSAGNLTVVSGNSLYRVSTTFGSPTATLVSTFNNTQGIYSGLALQSVPEPSMALFASFALIPMMRRRRNRK